jgi:hypothetical protein
MSATACLDRTAWSPVLLAAVPLCQRSAEQLQVLCTFSRGQPTAMPCGIIPTTSSTKRICRLQQLTGTRKSVHLPQQLHLVGHWLMLDLPNDTVIAADPAVHTEPAR